jgi:LPS-assembly lipoprotein
MSVIKGSFLRICFISVMSLVIAACGFQLQGVTPLPFDTLLVTIPENTEFGADVRRAIKAASPKTRIINARDERFDAELQQVSQTRTAREVSLNAQGRVEEFELTLTYTFRIVDANRDVILPNTTLVATRDMPFDDQVVQAKEGEQATLFRQMQKSLVSRLMRRISAPDVAENYQKLQAAKRNG